MNERPSDPGAAERNGTPPLAWEDVRGVAVLRLRPHQLDSLPQLECFHDEARKLIDVGAHKILLDLVEVEGVCGAALSYLLRLDKRVKEAGGRLALCTVPPLVLHVLRFTRLDPLLEIHPDEATAVDALTS